MWIKIIPNDTLFFRLGRPFSMGTETWADTIFPPYPSTIFGALRTFLLFQRGSLKDFKEKGYPDIGSPASKGKMKIVGPILYGLNNNVLYFKTPYDLVQSKENKKGQKVLSLQIIRKPKLYYSEEGLSEILIFKGKESVEETTSYLDNITFRKYLENKDKEYNYVPENSFYKYEFKIGISRDRLTLTSKEGHLYRIPLIRLNKEYGFLIKIEDVTEMPEKGVFQLGGEGKTVSFEKVESNPLQDLENFNFTLNNGVFKLYLATPAIFKKGWIPEWINEETFEGEKDGIKIKLISCAIGRHIRIGGWDIAKEEPKLMYKAVPAGSIYYFKVQQETAPEKIKEVFHIRNISDISPEEGFGLSFVGVVL